MLLEWKSEYAIGIPQIDAQHREIFRRVAKLHEALWKGEVGEELVRVFAFLDEYTQTHFRDEEELMTACQYSLLPLHRAEHQDLIRRLAVWKAGVSRGDLGLTLQVVTTLAEWLRSHITLSDQALAYVIRDQGKAA
jgi:hemerythrin